jgi:hypothetical protein
MKPCGYASKTKAGWHIKFKLGNPHNTLLYALIDQVTQLILKKNGWIQTYRWSREKLKPEGYLGWSKTGNVLILKNKTICIIDPQELLEVATARRPFTKIYEGNPF